MTTDTGSSAPAGYLQLIRGNRNFRYLWFGQIVSLLGDWLNIIASASLVATLTQSGFAIGSLFVVRMLAPFLVSPIAGVVADRYNRKHILIMTDIARTVTVFCFLFVRDSGDVWLLYTLTAIQLGVSGFFYPTRTAILPDIVSWRELGAANALSSATWSVMMAFGAALGGLVSGVWGIYPAFVVDGLSFLLSALLILQVRLNVAPALGTAEKSVRAALRDYVDGLRFLRRNVHILAIALNKPALALLTFSGFQIAQVAIAEGVFVIGQGGGIALGLMFGMSGVGTGIGPILARSVTGDRDRSLRRAMSLAYLLGGVGLTITAPLVSFKWFLFGGLLRAIGGGIVWVFSTQLLLHLVPAEVRGRVFATEFALFALMSAVGSAIAGWVLDTSLGIPGILWGMAGLSLIPTVLWTFWLGKIEREKGG